MGKNCIALVKPWYVLVRAKEWKSYNMNDRSIYMLSVGVFIQDTAGAENIRRQSTHASHRRADREFTLGHFFRFCVAQ